MITKEQALSLGLGHEVHEDGCKRVVGPRNGVTTTVHRWRISGRPVEFKTRPDNWYVPIKFGLRQSSRINTLTMGSLHIVEMCPLLATEDKSIG